MSGTTPIRYSVFFSNKETATAPAQRVVITDQLDVRNDNLGTFSLGPMTFGSQLLTPPPFQTSYSITVDLRPGTNLLVAVTANLNQSTGLLTWNFQSLDPATMQPPTDPTAGFLPPGGEGSVFFTVMSKQGLPTNTQIRNQASIVFDVNPAIATPTWLNTLDNTPPTSFVHALPSNEPTIGFTVSWSGTDVGAGVQDFTIYVSDNGGPFTVWQQNVTATSATFTGQTGHTYAFYSIARDLVEKVEAAKTSAETTTKVSGDTTPPVTTASVAGLAGNNGWYRGSVTITLSATDPDSRVAATYYSLDAGATVTYATPFTISRDGAHQVSFYSVDPAGNKENPNALTIKIDATPPAVTVAASPALLWPPNGTMVPVRISGTIKDATSGVNPGSATFTVVDEYGSVQPSGSVTVGTNGSYSFTVPLQASRLGTDQDGRLYTVVVKAQDNAGNQASSSTAVLVPHDQGLPRLSGGIRSKLKTAGLVTLTIQITNTGSGTARNLQINQLPLRTLAGTGAADLATPGLPMSVADLAPGASASLTLRLNVPNTLTKFSVTENGTMQDSSGILYNYSIGQVVFP